MKIHEFKLKPLSGFGTPIVGDTLFGHLCWQLAYDPALASLTLDQLLADYRQNPFVVLSNAYPRLETGGSIRYALRRPDIPLSFLFAQSSGDTADMIRKRKELKARKWMLVNETFLANGFSDEMFVSDEVIFKLSALKSTTAKYAVSFSQARNKINRLTGTTGEAGFSPFNVVQKIYAPGAELSVFVGIDTDRISVDSVSESLKRIGETGYGRDVSTGLGRFDIAACFEVDFRRSVGANACYTLSPSLPGNTPWREMFFNPVIRYGRHGGGLAGTRHPFKAPARMAMEGAVYVANGGGLPTEPYIGEAVTGVSITEPRSVVQGYSLFIPFRLEAAI